MEHGREHEEFLQRLLLGETDAHEAPARERLDACPACRTELERLRSLDLELLGATARARETLTQASASADGRDEARVRATLQAVLARRRGQGRRRFVIFALAAAAILVMGWAALRAPRPARHLPEFQLGGTIQGMTPQGVVSEYRFAWNYELQPLWSFEIVIRTAGGGQIVRTVRKLEATRWNATPEELRALPDDIRWEVTVFDENGTTVDHGWADASRRL